MNVSDWQQRQQAVADGIRLKRNARAHELRELTKQGLHKPKRRHLMYMGVHDEQHCRHPACLAQRYARIAKETRARGDQLQRAAAEARLRAQEDDEGVPF